MTIASDLDLFFQQSIKQNIFSDLDCHLSLFLAQRSKLKDQDKAKLRFLICYLSAEVRAGHVCILLSHVASAQFIDGYKKKFVGRFPSLFAQISRHDWSTLLVVSGIVSQGRENAPLILTNERLYFQRMWLDEQKVAYFFRQSVTATRKAPINIVTILDSLFDGKANITVDWQKIAVVLGLIRQVAIISGGPGTGKTTTVVKLLTAIAMAKFDNITPLRIAAAAPTGKAAARLTELLNNNDLNRLSKSNPSLLLPREAVTLHRLLVANSNKQYLYHRNNPLHLDMLIVDEASMVDLSMMAALIDALPQNARLILLGDKEQLSSVEAGVVFGDLCRFADNVYNEELAGDLGRLTGYTIPMRKRTATIADNICLLTKSYRFNEQSGIGLLANYVKKGQSQEALKLLCSKSYADIDFYDFDDGTYHTIIDRAIQGYAAYWRAVNNSENPLSILLAFEHFRLLAAVREGKYGVVGLNMAIEKVLLEEQLTIRSHRDDWYLGRPVMILKNYPPLKLYNGDIGITLLSDVNSREKRVYFRLADGTVRSYPPHLLPEHETAFVMTVHKSQGSEFNHIALILPDQSTSLLTRSLLYTAVTRAKRKISLYSSRSILLKTIDCQVERRSGLSEMTTPLVTNLMEME